MGQAGFDADASTILRLWKLADCTIPIAIRAASTLGIADYLISGPLSVEKLATTSGMNAPSLRRILRALAQNGVFEEIEPDHFGLSPVAELLRSDHPLSLCDAYRLSSLEVLSWGALAYCLRTGKAAFEHVHGEGHRAYRASHPEEDIRMDRAHRAGTRVDVLTIMRVYNWSNVRTVVDVGGGTGAFLAGLLSRFKDMRGVLFDLPRMVANAGEILANAGVADRCEVVGGDFFASVPPGRDVYILKAVVGGWDDDSARLILRTVRSAMREDSRLLIIEPIMQYGEDFTAGNVIHLQSLVLYGGPDRTREDYDRIIAPSGLSVTRVIQRATLPILELAPV